MPALMGETNSAQSLKSTKVYEMDKLVEEVRERLCLRGREKLNAVRRSTPYSRKGCAFVDTPENGESLHRFSQRARADCYGAKRDNCSQCSWRMTKCKCSGRSSDFKSETPNLLKQLLAEHRLIQEAVRRIHLFEHGGERVPTTCVSSTDLGQSCSSPCSARSVSTDSVGSSTFSSTSDVSGSML